MLFLPMLRSFSATETREQDPESAPLPQLEFTIPARGTILSNEINATESTNLLIRIALDSLSCFPVQRINILGANVAQQQRRIIGSEG